MEFSNPILPNTSIDSDPLVAGIPPLYDDRLIDEPLPQTGSIDPLSQPTFTVIENPAIDASGTVSESPVVSDNFDQVSETDASFPTLETPEPSDTEMEDDELLTNADDAAIETQEDLEDVTVEEDETEDDTIADEVEIAVDPIPEIEPVPTIELSSDRSGIYTVGNDGTVLIDYAYDDSKYQPQVAVISTEGLEAFLPENPDSSDLEAFSPLEAEVARRALSNSEHGYIVLDDTTQGAKFSRSKWGPNLNSGTYSGVQSFQMRPGDNVMLVVVPNGTFQEVLDEPTPNGSKRFLFSFSPLNPEGNVQFAQVVPGGADGNLIAIEEFRLDRHSQGDFNGIVLQMRGVTGQTPLLSDVIDSDEGFWSRDMGQALIDYVEPYLTPAPIDLPIVPDIEDLPSVGVINTSVTQDNDTAEAGSETTVIRDDEVIAEENTDPAEDETVIDAPDTTAEESEDVEDTIPDDETVEISTGFAGVPTISTSPPEPYNFATKNQPTIVVIDTGFSGNNPDIQYNNISSGTDFVTGDNNSFLSPGEGSEHGTHILGIIAATQNNGVGINGINDDAPIVVIRAIGSGRIAEAIIEGVDRIQASGQPNGIINLSLDLTQINPDGSITPRYELTPEEREAIEYARQHGVILAVAAGNDGGVMSVLGQASQEFDNIITVGAAERVNGEIAASKAFDRSDYSSFGRGLDIVAPGGTVDNPVLSTVSDGVGTMAGTSVATAKVTGAASQIWAANSGLNYRQVIEILKSTSTDLDTPNWDGETGFGLLNIDAAVKVAKVTAPEEYAPPVSFIPETWSGEGIVTPLERAADFAGSVDWGKTAVQINGGVNLRSGPGTSYDYWGRVSSDETLVFDIQQEGEFVQDPNGQGGSSTWYRLANGQGWMSALYVQYQGEVLPTLPPEDNYNPPPEDDNNPPPEDDNNPPPANSGYIYLSTEAATLLEVDPVTGAQRPIYIDQFLTDVALSPQGRLYGASFWDLYEIDVATGQMTHLGEFPEENDINALTFSPDGQLYGADETGNLFLISTQNAQLTPVGHLGGPSSGDLVFYNNSQFYATVGSLNLPTDQLISVDINTGQSQAIFDLGVDEVYGLTLVNETLMGYSSAGNPIVIDPNARTVEVQPEIYTLDELYGATAAISSGYTPPPDDDLNPPTPTRNPYTIEAGDTLWEIAQTLLGNGNRWVELQKEDGTTFTSDEATRLQIGQVVYVPTSQTSSVPPQAIPGQESQYIVQPEDTLWEIAYWNLGDGNRWREIRKTPGGEGFTEEEARQLQVGQSIYLPVGYEVGLGTPAIEVSYPEPIPSAKGGTVRTGEIGLGIKPQLDELNLAIERLQEDLKGKQELIEALNTENQELSNLVISTENQLSEIKKNWFWWIWNKDDVEKLERDLEIYNGQKNVNEDLLSFTIQETSDIEDRLSSQELERNNIEDRYQHYMELYHFTEEQWKNATSDDKLINNGDSNIRKLLYELSTQLFGKSYLTTSGYVADQDYYDGYGKPLNIGWHDGIDIDTPNFPTDVKVLVGGNIRELSYSRKPDIGYAVVVEGDDGRFYHYLHLSSLTNTSGRIEAGEVLGKVGETDKYSISNHLHFQVNKTQKTDEGTSPDQPPIKIHDKDDVYRWTLNPLKVFWELNWYGK